jgi:hypothetical protein
MRNPLLWMSGADLDVLDRCPSERKKFVAMGGTVATTSCLAALSATFTADDFLHTGIVAAVIVGLGWGLAIMTLDRFLVMTIRRQGSALGTLALAAPRVALAIVAGLVIAEPAVLRIFNSEVTAQAVLDRQDAYAAGVNKLSSDYASIPKLQGEVSSLQRELTTTDPGAVLVTDPEYRIASAQVNKLQQRAAAAESAALCELDGSCGTRHAGAGSAYDAKADQAQLAVLVGERAAARSRLLSAYRAPIGLLDRVEALGVLTSRHSAMATWNTLITLLILLLDCSPAISKALMSIGRPSLYERVQDAHEAKLAAREEADRALADAALDSELRAADELHRAEEDAARIEAGIVIDEAKLRRHAENEVIADLVRRAAEVQRRAGELFIAAWGEATLAAVPAQVRAALRRMAMSNGHGAGAAGDSSVGPPPAAAGDPAQPGPTRDGRDPRDGRWAA